MPPPHCCYCLSIYGSASLPPCPSRVPPFHPPPPPPNKSFLKGGRPTEGSDLWWRGGGALGAQRCCVPRFPHRLLGKPQTPNVGEGGTSWAGPGRAGKAVGRVGWEHPPKAPKYPAKVFNTGIKLEIRPNLLIVCYYPKNRKELKMTAPPHKDPRSQAPFSPSPPPVSMETAKYWGAKP